MSTLTLAKKFVPSPQQTVFFNWIESGSGSCVLEAVAGAGKTTTLVKALNMMSGSIFFGAYNKKIAVEIQNRAPNKPGLVISTMHAAGFAAWRKATRNIKVDGDKVRNIFRQACQRNVQYSVFEKPVLQLVSLAKQAGFGVDELIEMKSRSAWEQLVTHYDVETFDEKNDVNNTELIIKLSIKTLEASIAQNMQIIDFDDMIFAPLYHNASIDKFDWVLVDEAQDTNATRRLLALRMMHDTSRLVAVGDSRQAIYQFQGASSDAMGLIAHDTNAIKLPLSITYRCPKAVVAYAQQWVNHIQAADTAPDGIVRDAELDDLRKEARPGDAVVCRYNAPLVEHVYKFIADGIPARVEGREIGNGIKNLASRWKVKSLDAFETRLDAYRDREIAKWTAKEQDAKVQQVEDQVACVRIFMDRVRLQDPMTKTPGTLICAEVDKVFGEEGTEASVVSMMSIHKSKGREFQRVVWLQTTPNKRARLDWQVEAELNLNYVAATRAMHELVLIQSGK